jgi:hypothetical protein
MDKRLANLPIPHNDIDWESVIKWISGCLAFIIAFWKYIDKYFADKKTEKETFIKTVVREAMESSLNEIKNDVIELKHFRESDMKHFNDTVLKIYAELRKP